MVDHDDIATPALQAMLCYFCSAGHALLLLLCSPCFATPALLGSVLHVVSACQWPIQMYINNTRIAIPCIIFSLYILIC
jgi:hypothetical protein